MNDVGAVLRLKSANVRNAAASFWVSQFVVFLFFFFFSFFFFFFSFFFLLTLFCSSFFSAEGTPVTFRACMWVAYANCAAGA